MALTQPEKLRQMLGEDIPTAGSAEDTLFTDEEVEEFILENPNLERAAYEGWRVKAARLSSLVDNTEGNIQRKFSQLLENAFDMIKMYKGSAEGPTEGRTRVGRATRPGVEW